MKYFINRMSNSLAFFFTVTVIIPMFLLIWTGNVYQGYRCESRAEKQGYTGDYDWIDGCYFEKDGKYIAEDRLRIVE